MAVSLDINSSSYNGELALPYLAPAVLSADSISRGLIKVHENIKHKAVMKKLTNSTEIVAAASGACSFSATAGDLDLDETVLEITELKVNQELCKNDFRADWEAYNMGRGAANQSLPNQFESFLIQFLAGKVQENIEKSIWGGNFDPTDSDGGSSYVTTSFDGLLHHIVDANASLGYDDEAAGAMTADDDSTTGVITRLDKVVKNAPSAILNSLESKIYMSRKSAYLLQRALGGFVTSTTGSDSATSTAAQGLADPGVLTGAVPLSFMGFDIVVPQGCPDDTIVFTHPENLHFGCDLFTDQTSVNVVDMAKTDGSDTVRFAMRFGGGTQIGFAGDISVSRRIS